MSTLLFDIGGTYTRMALADKGTVGKVEKIPTPREPREGVAALLHFAKGKATEVRGGIAGTVVDGIVQKAPNLPEWGGYALGEAFGIPATVANDVAVEALGEAVEGAGKGARVVAYLSIGTGVGGAVVEDGCIALGASGFEPGHQILSVEQSRTLEDCVGGRSLSIETGRSADTLPQSVYDARTAFVAAGVVNAIRHWSPGVVVLGGALITGKPGFKLHLIEKEAARLMRGYPMPPVRVATLGDRAGLLGAHRLGTQ